MYRIAAAALFCLLPAYGQIVQKGPLQTPKVAAAACGDGTWQYVSPSEDTLLRWNPATNQSTIIASNQSLGGKTLLPTSPSPQVPWKNLACIGETSYLLAYGLDLVNWNNFHTKRDILWLVKVESDGKLSTVLSPQGPPPKPGWPVDFISLLLRLESRNSRVFTAFTYSMFNRPSEGPGGTADIEPMKFVVSSQAPGREFTDNTASSVIPSKIYAWQMYSNNGQSDIYLVKNQVFESIFGGQVLTGMSATLQNNPVYNLTAISGGAVAMPVVNGVRSAVYISEDKQISYLFRSYTTVAGFPVSSIRGMAAAENKSVSFFMDLPNGSLGLFTWTPGDPDIRKVIDETQMSSNSQQLRFSQIKENNGAFGFQVDTVQGTNTTATQLYVMHRPKLPQSVEGKAGQALLIPCSDCYGEVTAAIGGQIVHPKLTPNGLLFESADVPAGTNKLALTFTGEFGSSAQYTVTASITGTVIPPTPTPAKIIGYGVFPNTIKYGDTAKLCLYASDAASITLFPPAGTLDGNGCIQVTPSSTTTYTVTVTGTDKVPLLADAKLVVIKPVTLAILTNDGQEDRTPHIVRGGTFAVLGFFGPDQSALSAKACGVDLKVIKLTSHANSVDLTQPDRLDLAAPETIADTSCNLTVTWSYPELNLTASSEAVAVPVVDQYFAAYPYLKPQADGMPTVWGQTAGGKPVIGLDGILGTWPDGTFVIGPGLPDTQTRPAEVGQILAIWVAGCGKLDQNGMMVNPPLMKFGGNPTAILYAGQAPGVPGFCQINFVVPEGATPDPTWGHHNDQTNTGTQPIEFTDQAGNRIGDYFHLWEKKPAVQ